MDEEDKILILKYTANFWKKNFLKGGTIFVTGATGFFGKNLLDSFIYINTTLKLNISLIALTRDKQKFLADFPQFNHYSIELLEGNITNFSFPEQPVDYIIHAANDLEENQEILNIDDRPIIIGTRRILNLAKEKNVKAILHTSSGAVYGSILQQNEILESQYQASNEIQSNNYYSANKRYIEFLCNDYFAKQNVPSKIARCFAFLGPYLPLDRHYAVGNFIKNLIENQSITINGDGRICRSYLYSADLCIWLWTILFNGKICSPYNVGSNYYYSLNEIAKKVAQNSMPNIAIEILNNNQNMQHSWYIPSVEKSKNELGLSIYTTIEIAIKKTITHYTTNRYD
jgi:nucleoside-diphosphate-sugar epimerase